MSNVSNLFSMSKENNDRLKEIVSDQFSHNKIERKSGGGDNGGMDLTNHRLTALERRADQTDAKLDKLIDSIHGLDKSIGALSGRIDTMSSALGGRVDTMSSTLGGRIDTMSSTLDGRINTVSGNLGGRLNLIEQKTPSWWQPYVGAGGVGLVIALLTHFLR